MTKTTTLHDEKGRPLAICNIAEASAHNLNGTGFPFGIDRDNAAASLRLLAGAIEAGDAILTDVRHITRADPDDFTEQTVMVKFVAKRPTE